MISDLDSAMDAARSSAKGGPMDAFVERMAERVGGKAGVKAAFGDPIERDGITVIPVAKVRYGFGGGSGMGPMANRAWGTSGGVGTGTGSGIGEDATAPGDKAAEVGSGSGAGGGVMADPIGYVEIGPEGATYRALQPPMPSPLFILAAGATFALIVGSIARLISLRRS